MKTLMTLFLVALIPFFGFSQSDDLLFTTGNWSDSELSAEQLTKLDKIRSNFPINQIYKVDFGNLGTRQIDGKIEIEVPNDECEKVIFIAKDVRYISDDNYYWYGILEPNDPNDEGDCNCEDGYIVLIKRADELFGTIQLQTRTYLIESLSNNKNVIVREPDEWTDNTICGVDQSLSSIQGNNPKSIQPRSGGQCDVSVLFVFTESVGENLANPENTAENILETTNQALRNSSIHSGELRLRLAGVEEITDVDEDGMDSEQALNAVTFSSPQTQNLRNQLGADIVLLLINQNIASFGNVNGRAWVGPNPNFAHGVFRAFGVGTTPAHEIAHIFGCRHEPCSADNAGGNCNDPELPHRQAHSFEFTRTEGCWPFRKDVTHERQTIVFSVSRDTRILNYSNPEVNVEGQPTGIENERDNSRWLVDNACTVANFRDDGSPYVLSISSWYYDNCPGATIVFSPNFDGGCPGMSTWKWYQSNDGINYQYVSGNDNEDLDADFPDFDENLFVRCDAISPCGEITQDFITIYSDCDIDWDPEGLISGNGSVSPNPIQNNVINFSFTLEKSKKVSYDLIDIMGSVIDSKQLGILDPGSYEYIHSLPPSSPNTIVLKLNLGNKTETIKVIKYD